MTKNNHALAILSLLVTLSGHAQVCTAPGTPAVLQSFENINYKGNLAMDLYLPEVVDHPLPVAFIVHGGAWVAGQRQDFTALAKQLTGMGYAAATVSYTLTGFSTGKFPAPIEDLRCALKTLKSQAGTYGLDSSRVLGIGFSAGAHLIAETGLTADTNDFNDILCPVQDNDASVSGIIGYYGPYDLRKTDGLSFQQISILINFLGGLPSLKPDVASLASPAAQIHNETLPFYLVHAADDNVVPVRSSQEFSAALAASQNPVEYVETAAGAHSLQLFDSRDFANAATCGSISYLDRFYNRQL